MKKPGTYIDYHVKPHLCTKFGDSSLKNEFRNAKRVRLIKWSIMRIFNEAEPPWSNLSEILGLNVLAKFDIKLYVIISSSYVNSNWSYSPAHKWGSTSMIELVRDLRTINVLAKFENDLKNYGPVIFHVVLGDNSWKFHDDTMMGT